MKLYLQEMKKKIMNFKAFEIKQIPRKGNVHAHSLATLALIFIFELKRAIPMSCLLEPNIIGKMDKNKKKQVSIPQHTHLV